MDTSRNEELNLDTNSIEEYPNVRSVELYKTLVGGEEIAKRQEFSKHFDLGEGRHQAVVYGESVHYREAEDAQWLEIDNNLEDAQDKDGRAVLRNKASSMNVELAKQAGEGSLVRMTSKGHTLEWDLESIARNAEALVKPGAQMRLERLVAEAQRIAQLTGKKLTAKELDPELLDAAESQQDKRSDNMTKYAQVSYEDIAPGISVKYTLAGMKVTSSIAVQNTEALAHAALRLPMTYR
ncbi:hypothetical protein LJC33_08135 [Eubacteriales bacterium OttesenSCG-928-N13]|nr:hypothetical protein [Eubacteriales bacterium OttesenSCG-928-N13]